MKPEDLVKKTIRESDLHVDECVHQRILADALQRLETVTCKRTATYQLALRRLIMRSRMTKLVAAAAIVLAVVFSMILMNTSVPSAYAIEQTIEASHSVQYLHIRAITLSHGDYPVEFWVECAPDGRPKNMRLNLPDWMAPGAGPREVIWKDNKTQEWLKDKNILTTKEDSVMAAQVLKMMETLDPKLTVTRLQEKQQQGKVELEINPSTHNDQAIQVIASSTPADDASFQRMVLTIDPATKLVNTIKLYKLKGGEYEHVRTLEYYDYNQPIDANMFRFRDVSPDAEQIDFMTLGLAQGNLSKEEIAAKVVRQFLDAIIAKEYGNASKLLNGLPADFVKDEFGALNIIRSVVGTPILDAKTDGLRVPFEVEVKKDGKTSLLKDEEGALVQPLAGQTGRWIIILDD